MDNTVRRRILIAVLAASVLPIVQSAMASSALFAIKESYELHPHASQLVRILAVGPALAVVLAVAGTYTMEFNPDGAATGSVQIQLTAAD